MQFPRKWVAWIWIPSEQHESWSQLSHFLDECFSLKFVCKSQLDAICILKRVSHPHLNISFKRQTTYFKSHQTDIFTVQLKSGALHSKETRAFLACSGFLSDSCKLAIWYTIPCLLLITWEFLSKTPKYNYRNSEHSPLLGFGCKSQF